jgi:hypothetical protein
MNENAVIVYREKSGRREGEGERRKKNGTHSLSFSSCSFKSTETNGVHVQLKLRQRSKKNDNFKEQKCWDCFLCSMFLSSHLFLFFHLISLPWPPANLLFNLLSPSSSPVFLPPSSTLPAWCPSSRWFGHP